MESEHAKGTVEHAKQNPEVKNEDGTIFPEEKAPDFSSLSPSSSSTSSSEFDIADKGLFDEKYLFSGLESVSPPDSPTQTPEWSMLSASPSPAEIGAQFLPEFSTASPPGQTMGQPPGYDPNRIPLSVFSTKASNPADWSVASNESLFSIHMGKSGELPRLDEYNNEPSILPPVIEHEESSLISDKDSRQNSSNSVTVNNNHWTTMENHVNEKMSPADFKRAPPAETTLNSSSTPRTSTSNPRLSDESGNSSSSFAFPVLVSDGGVKTNSLKGVAMDNPDKNQQLQAQVSKATSKAPKRRRCCWFCCWPRCC